MQAPPCTTFPTRENASFLSLGGTGNDRYMAACNYSIVVNREINYSVDAVYFVKQKWMNSSMLWARNHASPTQVPARSGLLELEIEATMRKWKDVSYEALSLSRIKNVFFVPVSLSQCKPVCGEQMILWKME